MDRRVARQERLADSIRAQQAREHSFEERGSDAVAPRVTVGTWVKVGLRHERFWCRVRAIEPDGTLQAEVENELINSPLRVGDRVCLQQRNVLEMATARDRELFCSHAVALGSVTDAALEWYQSRGKVGEGATPKPNTTLHVGKEAFVLLGTK